MRALIIAVSVLGILIGAGSAKAERRVALLFGNGAYQNLPRLANAPGDAKALADLLRKVGFDVVEAIDVSHQQMTEHLLAFGKKAEGADIALFYYAGQSVAVSGVGYLLPVDADIKPGTDIKLGRGIDFDAATDQAMGAAGVRLIFLDGSRDDPFKGSRHPATGVPAGKAPLIGAKPTNTGFLIGYATGPGQTASDGKEGGHRPFTKALLDNIAKPGVELQQAMSAVRAQVMEETSKSQMAWGRSNLAGPVYLNAAPASSQAPKN